jgi:hypothetical protein
VSNRLTLFFILIVVSLGLHSQNPYVGQTKIYSVIEQPDVVYTWSVPADWSVLNGQGTDSIEVIVGMLSGYVVVTPSNTCGDGIPQERYFEPIDSTATGLPQQIASSFKFYPNPVSDFLTAEFDNRIGEFEIEIYDMRGSLIPVNTETTSNRIIADFSKLPPGIYNARIHIGGYSINRKIVHQ